MLNGCRTDQLADNSNHWKEIFLLEIIENGPGLMQFHIFSNEISDKICG